MPLSKADAIRLVIHEHIEGFDLLPKRVEILGFFRHVNAFGMLLKRVKNLILF